jgi:hypothetical protein
MFRVEMDRKNDGLLFVKQNVMLQVEPDLKGEP